ncbi:minor tail protein [Microbacterium phage Nebulous]|nr:minor tail protein [Microbacterium phage Nebulous]
MADANTGSNAILRMEAWVTGTSVGGNYNNFHWKLSLIERTGQTFGWSGGLGASVEVFWDGGGYTVPWSGSFAFDFRPGGQQSVVIAEGDLNGMGNFGDGSPRTFTFRGNMANSGTSTVGGPTSVDQAVAGAWTRVAPGAPSGVGAVYVSDTQITLNWSNTGPSNGPSQTNQILQSVDGGAFTQILDIGATSSAVIGVSANHKYQFKVKAWNSPAGFGPESAASAAVYTTPGAPTNAVATKLANQDIQITFTENVNYAEYNHEVWHGVVVGGVTTWDGAALTTLASGVLSYTHAAPNPSQIHVYRVRAKQGTLLSAYAVSNSVQLLIAPNAPTVNAPPTYQDKTIQPNFSWVHNSVDTTPQSAYELRYSTDGGSTWTTTGKVVSTANNRTIATLFPANTALQVQVRTWGQATTGGSEGTGASPFSATRTTTFKTVPVATVPVPANGSNLNDSVIRATVGFAQAEGATFVKAELELKQGATLLEARESTVLVGIAFDTPALNGQSYTVRARVQDSNGLWSAWASTTFNIVYLAPVPAVGAVSYLEASGYGQIDLTIAAPGAGQAAATTVTITRTINGATETVVDNYPVSPALTFLDTTPTIKGTNYYTITTFSALGAKSSINLTLVTNECRRAFLSKGPGFGTVGVFGGNLEVDESASVASATVEAAGRTKPIGLYGVETSLQLKVKTFVYENFGSSMDELRALLLVPGKACYRDATGRRVFGVAKGGLNYKKTTRGDFSFTITETS